jgi:radical SAM superfamily enzyme YgiQ (UPF0313 family)
MSIVKLKKIKGIVFKNKDEIIINEPREFIQNLDLFPTPKHEYFEDRIKKDKIIYVSTSRGCPIGCTFCRTSIHWGRRFRYRSVNKIINELKYLKSKFPNITKIYFQDDETILNKYFAKNLFNAIIKEKIQLKFECAGRVTSVDEELIKLMKKAGCIKLNLGVESGSPKIIKNIQKKITNQQIVNAFDICKKYNLKTGIYLMVGLPGENSKTIKETISLIKKIKEGELDFPSIFQLYPGTPIYEDAKKKKFINDDYWLTDKAAPFYTLENSKKKLIFWSFKINFYHKFYRGETLKYFSNFLKNSLKKDKLKRILKLYTK